VGSAVGGVDTHLDLHRFLCALLFERARVRGILRRRVTFNSTGRTLSYKGQSFQSLKGQGFKANYRETETGEQYWISGPRRDGLDRLYGKSALVVEIDADVREE
jgi:hypothetical protein